MSQERNEKHRLAEYYQKTGGRPPRETLVAALKGFKADGLMPDSLLAIDLGCGAGQDSLELLKQGFRVLAIDKQPEAIARLQSQAEPFALSRLQTQTVSFEELAYLPPADLINASISLPFCHPDHFERLWTTIGDSLGNNGRFAGHLFGINDSWNNSAKVPPMTFHTAAQVQELMQAFEVEFYAERERDGKTVLGKQKHWHIFHIVARKLS